MADGGSWLTYANRTGAPNADFTSPASSPTSFGDALAEPAAPPFNGSPSRADARRDTCQVTHATPTAVYLCAG